MNTTTRSIFRASVLTVAMTLFVSSPANAATGILSSVVGYNIGSPMRVIIRSSDSTYLQANATFDLQTKSGSSVQTGSVAKWGGRWQQYWWVADFSGITQAGTYKMIVKNGATTIATSDTFLVADNILWNRTWFTVGVTQSEQRAALGSHKPGWQDCGSSMQEASSHASQVLGLEDMLDYVALSMPDTSKARLIKQIKIGCDYLVDSQDSCRVYAKLDGPLFHDLPIFASQRRDNVITGDLTKASLVWTKASRLLKDADPTMSARYLDRAIRAFHYLRVNGSFCIYYNSTDYGSGSNPSTSGGCGMDGNAYKVPLTIMTTDLVMQLWAAVELTKCGHPEYQDTAVQLMDSLMARQIPSTEKEGPYYGHFRPYKGVSWSEKAWTHDGGSYLLGQTFPHYLMPAVEMLDLWPTNPKAAAWRRMLHDFAYGYFLPACSANPFYLLPQGYYTCPTNEGLIDFGGVWHARNGSYGHAAALAFEFERIFNDPQFRKISAGNMQWIAGLNAGITNKQFKVPRSPGENPPYGGWQLAGDTAYPVSQIVKIGDRWFGGWSGIAGTISNGFSADTQFQISSPHASTDGPNFFTDEDWIVHSGGWLSAIAYSRKNSTSTISDRRGLNEHALSHRSPGVTYQPGVLMVSNLSIQNPVSIVLCDLSGRTMLRTTICAVTAFAGTDDGIRIQTGRLHSGIYLVKVQSRSSLIQQQLMVRR